MCLFQRPLYQPKHKEKPTGEQSIYRILAPSFIAIFICAVCLCGTSWAWFTASTSTGTTAIQSSSYKLVYQIGKDTTATELAEKGTAYTLTEDTTKITLKASGTTDATGYCSIKVGDKTYYTEQIFVDGTFTFTVNAATGTKIILTPKWGTYFGAADILDNGSIGTSSNSQPTQNGNQAQQTEEKNENRTEETVQTSTEATTTKATEESDNAANTTENTTEQTE